MKFFRSVSVAALLLCALGPALRAEAPSLLASALQKLVQEEDQWAYTQVIRRTDRDSGDTVARFDPTKPRGEQWELVKLRGRAPTDAEAEKWQRRRSSEVNQSDERAVFDLLDLEHANVAAETPNTVRYEVPLKKTMIGKVPTDNFIAFAEVGREDGLLQRITVVLKQSIKLIGGIAQIESAHGEVIFAQLGDQDCARPTRIVASGAGSALFRKVNRSAEILYTDQRRVKAARDS